MSTPLQHDAQGKISPVAPSRELRRIQCYLLLILCDALAICITFAAVGFTIDGPEGASASVLHSELVLLIFVPIALYDGAYSIASLQNAWVGVFRALAAMVTAMVMAVFFHFLIKPEVDIPRLAFTGGAIGAMIAIIGFRLALRRFVRWFCGETVINELVIDDGGPVIHPHGAVRLSAAALGLAPKLDDPEALDRLGLVLRNIDRVIVSCPPDRRPAWAMMLKGANIEGEVLNDEVVRLGAQGARMIEDHGMLLVSAGPLGVRDRLCKRLFDVAFAGTALVILSWLLILVALAVKLQDGGPVFFTQRRMGRGNRFFNMYKFRSMTQTLSDATGTISASKSDKRITMVGRFIRRTSIDELPQLFNVLLGDMSLVGPRPHATGSLAGDKLFWEIDARYWQRHALKPGLSGLAQVRGFRGATDHESDLINRLQADLEYLEGWTIMRDLQIIFLTLRVLVHDRAF